MTLFLYISDMQINDIHQVNTVSDTGEVTSTHPAYGKIEITSPQGGSRHLCGSSIPHMNTISIVIREAELHCSHGVENLFGKRPLIEVELSHQQFAHLVASVGNGSGTACTLRYVRNIETNEVTKIPGIKVQDTLGDSIKKQHNATLAKTIDGIDKRISDVEVLIGKGKANKGELVEIINSLKTVRQEIVDNLPFYFTQFNEHIEEKTNDAIMQIEGIINNNIKYLGVQQSGKQYLLGDFQGETNG